jgi:hypothetical protein
VARSSCCPSGSLSLSFSHTCTYFFALPTTGMSSSLAGTAVCARRTWTPQRPLLLLETRRAFKIGRKPPFATRSPEAGSFWVPKASVFSPPIPWKRLRLRTWRKSATRLILWMRLLSDHFRTARLELTSILRRHR